MGILGLVRASFPSGGVMLIALILLLVSIVLALVSRHVSPDLLALWAIGAALIIPHVRGLF